MMFEAALTGKPFPTTNGVQGGITEEPLNTSQRMEIINVLFDRGLGKPSQSVVIDAQIRALFATNASPQLEALAGISDDSLAEFERLALGVGIDASKMLAAPSDEE
jgi:hypothetical protein